MFLLQFLYDLNTSCITVYLRELHDVWLQIKRPTPACSSFFVWKNQLIKNNTCRNLRVREMRQSHATFCFLLRCVQTKQVLIFQTIGSLFFLLSGAPAGAARYCYHQLPAHWQQEFMSLIRAVSLSSQRTLLLAEGTAAGPNLRFPMGTLVGVCVKFFLR